MRNHARVLAWITPATPFGADAPTSPAERASHAALMAVADFYVALQSVKTVEQALKLYHLIENVQQAVESAGRSVLHKADSF